MGTIEASVQLFNGMTPTLRSITNALNITISAFEQMERASNGSIDTASLRAARNEIRNAEASIPEMERSFRNAGHTGRQSLRGIGNEGRNVGNIMQNIRQQASGLTGTLRNLAGAYLSFRGLDFTGKLSDSITSVQSRLNLMNDGLQSTQELSDKIMRASFESGAGYLDTAESIAKMGLNAGAAFNSNDELIAFMDQVNKMFAIGGASSVEQSNAMIQLSQALAAGALRGEELNSILDGAPGIARNIEKYMNWEEGSIKKYAEDGKVTAQVVKNAMLSLAEETNEKFNSMPTTISRTFTKIKTLAVKSFSPVLQSINELFNNQNANELLYHWGAVFDYIADRVKAVIEKIKNVVNSEQFVAFSNSIMTAFSAAGAVITWVFDKIVNGFEYIVSHWEDWKPVFTGIAAAIGIITAAQWALNIAMYANPFTLIIGAIVILIVLFYKLIDHINKVKNTSLSATGIIAGAFGTLYAVAYNVFAGIWNKVAMFYYFFKNVSKDAIAAVKILFLEWTNDGLARIQTMVQALKGFAEHIPGISIAVDGLSKFDDWLTKAQNDTKGMINRINQQAGFEENKYLEYKDVEKTAEEFYNKVANFGSGMQQQMEHSNPFDGISSTNDLLGNILKNLENTAQDTNKIADDLKELKRDKEDLEFIRMAANIKYGDKYVMPQVKVEMTNNNQIQSEMDLDGFFDRKIEEMGNLLSQSAEGVHI